MGYENTLDTQIVRLKNVKREMTECHENRFSLSYRRKRSDLVQRVYADLIRQPRYRKAIRFLANDLLGNSDLGKRAEQLLKARSAMEKTLPRSMMETVINSIEFTAATLEIECHMVRYLNELGKEIYIDRDEGYVACLKKAIDRPLMEEQLGLVVKIGKEIDAVVRKPFVAVAIKISRGPAKMIGLEELQNFLERGFDAFKTMRGATEFLAEFQKREACIIDTIYTSEINPFSKI